MKTYIILLLSLLMLSCHDNDLIVEEKETLTELDKLFISGFSMELKQIYVVVNDKIEAELFIDSIESANINLYYYDFNVDSTCLNEMSENELWKIKPMKISERKVIIEHGYGSTYSTSSYTNYSYNTHIETENQYTKRIFSTTYIPGDIYSYRNKDNHILKIEVIKDNKELYSNLVLEILDFDSEYLIVSTNAQYSINQYIYPPLSSSQVRKEKEEGNYELYLMNGKTYYKIGENLYEPAPYGDNYRYVGSTNMNGLISDYSKLSYILEFKLL